MGKVTNAIGSAVGSLLGMQVTAPDVPEPAEMPDEEQIEAARRRRLAASQAAEGVQSTLLGAGRRETLG